MENNTSKPENEINEEVLLSKGFQPKVDTFPIILAVFITIANSLGLVLFARNRRLRTITNTFLVSLAISDLLTGLFGIPFYLVCSVTQLGGFCKTTMLFWRFTSTSTVLHLLAVTLDRYAAIVHAIRYHSIVTRIVAKMTILIIWVASSFVSLIQLAWPDEEELSELSKKEFEEAEEMLNRRTAIYQTSTLAIFFLLPLIVMVYSYIRIVIIVRYHEKQMKRQNMPSAGFVDEVQKKQNSFNIRAQWKSAIVFLVMTVVYVICWLPFFLYNLREKLELFRLPHWAEYVFFYYPRFVTSLSNPLFYIFGKNDFRKSLFKKRELQNGTQMTSLIGRGSEQR